MKVKQIGFLVQIMMILSIFIMPSYVFGAANCNDKDVSDAAGFVQALTDKCANIHLKSNITLNDSISVNVAPFKVDGTKSITINVPDGTVNLKNGIFSGSTVNVANGNLNGISLEFLTLNIFPDAVVSCLNCTVENGGSIGRLYYFGGSINGLFPIGTATNVVLSTKFNFDEGEYLEVASVKYASISSSEFSLKSGGAIKIKSVGDMSQVAMIANNKFVIQPDNTVNLDSIFEAASGTSMSKLGKPEILYARYDDSYYYVEMKTGLASDKFNNLECSGTAHERRVNFEPYVLNYGGENLKTAYPAGIYGYVESEGKKYVKIPRSKQVNGDNLENKRIAMLAHCEGTGTSKFSNVVELKICASNEQYVGGSCIHGDPAPECTEDNQCASDQICQDYVCVAKPAPTCSADSDCASGFYCESGVCINCDTITAADRVCTTVDGVETCKCPYRSSESSRCGGICVCEAGYNAVGSMCVNPVTGTPCSSTEEIFSFEKQICESTIVPPDPVPPAKGGGGCSLIR